MLIETELTNLKKCQRKKHSNTENHVDEMLMKCELGVQMLAYSDRFTNEKVI